jgi:hypothetical protein
MLLACLPDTTSNLVSEGISQEVREALLQVSAGDGTVGRGVAGLLAAPAAFASTRSGSSPFPTQPLGEFGLA